MPTCEHICNLTHIRGKNVWVEISGGEFSWGNFPKLDHSDDDMSLFLMPETKYPTILTKATREVLSRTKIMSIEQVPKIVA